MIVLQIPVGEMRNFCYVAGDGPASECVVIDPSWELERVMEGMSAMSMRAKYIVNTHHHDDHTRGNAELARLTGARVVQHEESGLPRDVAVRDGDVIEFGRSSLRVVHTPGHSRDSICLVGEGKAFTGDTLFVGSCGRTDLPGGSARELYRSLAGPVAALGDSLEVFPGHDYGPEPTSTIGRERATNPAMRARSEDEFAAMMGQ